MIRSLLGLLALGASVAEYHGGPQRHGLYLEPTLTRQSSPFVRLDPHFDGRVEGHVYAQPLYLEGKGEHGLVVVATESDVVDALDSSSGSVVWRRSLGDPVPRERLPCGNVDPLGITGTPVASPAADAIYLDAMVTPDGGKTKRHLLFALSAADGAVLPGWPVDVAAALHGLGLPFVAADQNQRSALALYRDTLVVVYGGHYGDCGDYHGTVVALPVRAPSRLQAWEVPARGGGMWAPGGPSVADGALFVTTGNTFGARRWSFGEAVLRFALAPFVPHPADSFAPSDWERLDRLDLDLGGSGPIPFDLGNRRLLAAFGKDGDVLLLDRDHLGGIGGQLARLHAAANPGGLRGSAAVFPLGQSEMIVLNGRGEGCPHGQSGDLTAVRVETSPSLGMHVAWCADSHGRAPPGGSPMVTSRDGLNDFVVWNVGAEGDERLHAFDGETGAVLFGGGGAGERMGFVRRFQTPIGVGGRVMGAGDGRVYAFRP